MWSFGVPSSRIESNKVHVREQVVGIVHRVDGRPDHVRVRVAFDRVTQRMTCSTYWDENHCAYDQRLRAPAELTTARSDVTHADWVFDCAAP